MPTTAFDWIARTVMLVLAGLVTLSILGSIAALSTDSGREGFAPGGERQSIETAPAAEENAATAQPQQAPVSGVSASADSAAGGAVASADPPKSEERWLEAIAYALLALAGLGAIAIVLLWSGVRELRRIGDAGASRPRQP
jgi:hypothetical protein